MLILCTSVAHGTFGDRLARPGLAWLTMETDGTLRDGSGAAVAWDDARPDWGE